MGANFNFNKAIIGGRLTADPELKHTQSGIPVCSFRVAVTRRKGKDEEQAKTDFIDVVAWRQQAEFLSRYFHKGSSICVVGSLQMRSWTDPQGQKRYATETVADEAYFVDAKGDASQSAGAPRPQDASQYVPEQYQTGASNFEELGDNEELPF